MLSDIVVQHVQVWWTKQSRGGPAAVQRNRVPVAYPLTGGEHRAAIHLVVHHESDGFDPRAETRGFTSDGQGKALRYADLALDRDGDQLRVSLQPSAFGMPRRHRRPTAVRLAAGQWLRWQINYRLVRINGGEWHYRLDTFNAAFGISAADLFLASRLGRSTSGRYCAEHRATCDHDRVGGPGIGIVTALEPEPVEVLVRDAISTPAIPSISNIPPMNCGHFGISTGCPTATRSSRRRPIVNSTSCNGCRPNCRFPSEPKLW